MSRSYKECKNEDKSMQGRTSMCTTIFTHIQYQSRRGHHRQRCEQTVEEKKRTNV
jgi:hypothetical protein